MGFRACVWDLDGTLLYTLPTIHHYCNQSLRHFGFHGITLDECRDLCRLSIAEFYHKLLKLGGCPPDRVAALQPAIRDYDCAAYLSDFTYLTQPYAGVCETLAELNRRGIKNAVLTNKPNAVACALIDRFFGDAMELCVGQTPETISKPDPHWTLCLSSWAYRVSRYSTSVTPMWTCRPHATRKRQPPLPHGAISRSKCCCPTIRNSSSADRNSCSRFFRRNSPCFRK